MTMAVTRWTQLENEVAKAVSRGIILDKRSEMPKGAAVWRKRVIEDIVGCCIHQSAGRNTKDPMQTARYHTSPKNHITPGRPLPSVVYHFMIPDNGDPAWYTTNILNRTYAQGAKDKDGFPGDENRHLIAVCLLGRFAGPGVRNATAGPSNDQLIRLWNLVYWLYSTFGFAAEGLFGHYHFGKAACPGNKVQSLIEEMRSYTPEFTDLDWQKALLDWDSNCLPRYGADGDWGSESKYALAQFQRASRLRRTALQDPFTELVLRRKHHKGCE